MSLNNNPIYIAARDNAFNYAKIGNEGIHFWTVREDGLEYRHYALPSGIVAITSVDPVL